MASGPELEENSDSNFEGDWESLCEYCGKKQSEHIYKSHPDPNYKQRIPCSLKNEAILAKHNSDVKLMREVVLPIWYIWDFWIPFIALCCFVIPLIVPGFEWHDVKLGDIPFGSIVFNILVITALCSKLVRVVKGFRRRIGLTTKNLTRS